MKCSIRNKNLEYSWFNNHFFPTTVLLIYSKKHFMSRINWKKMKKFKKLNKNKSNDLKSESTREGVRGYLVNKNKKFSFEKNFVYN